MSDVVVPSLVLSFECLVEQVRSGRQCVVHFEEHCAEGRCWLEVSVGGRRFPEWELSCAAVAQWDRGLFPDPGGGGEPVAVLCDPVNLDGSPRSALRGRLARRGADLSSLAAVVVASGCAALRLGMGSSLWCNALGGLATMMG